MPIKIDRLIRSRRRSLALIVERDGSLTVRAPLRAPDAQIRAFVESKAGWVKRKQIEAQASFVPAKQYREGEHFLYQGKSYTLKLVRSQRPALILDEYFRLSGSSLPKAENTFIRWYKARAAELFEKRAAHFATLYGFHYERIRISSARTRWGSCSAKGNLSFTWRLVMAPLEVIDYVVVHELVHLKHRNHSKQFWAGVAVILPDYKKQVRWLKANGRLLTLDSNY